MTRGDDVAEQAKTYVQTDVEEGLTASFTFRSDDRFRVELHESGLNDAEAMATSERLVVVPWVYPCTHTGEFLDVPATYVNLELRGTTFVDVRAENPDVWDFYRVIDWIGALHQIGIVTDTRPVLTDEEYRTWLERSAGGSAG